MNKSKTGAIGELAIANYLMEKGYEVFQNMSPTGPADLTVWNIETGKVLLVDVKSYRDPYRNKEGTYACTNNAFHRDDDVWQIAYIHGEASIWPPEGFFEALGCQTTYD